VELFKFAKKTPNLPTRVNTFAMAFRQIARPMWSSQLMLLLVRKHKYRLQLSTKLLIGKMVNYFFLLLNKSEGRGGVRPGPLPPTPPSGAKTINSKIDENVVLECDYSADESLGAKWKRVDGVRKLLLRLCDFWGLF
jgi:hypothetical protein